MTDKLTKVAMAIFAAVNEAAGEFCSWENAEPEDRDLSLSCARAAIAALDKENEQ